MSNFRYNQQHHTNHKYPQPSPNISADNSTPNRRRQPADDRQDSTQSSAEDKNDDAGPIARVGEFFFSSPIVGPLLPLIIAAPFIAMGLYYLLVVNAPTPVVKERMVETANSVISAVSDVFVRDGGQSADSFLDLLSSILVQNVEKSQ